MSPWPFSTFLSRALWQMLVWAPTIHSILMGPFDRSKLYRRNSAGSAEEEGIGRKEDKDKEEDKDNDEEEEEEDEEDEDKKEDVPSEGCFFQ